jgi:hypothetical protein
MPPRWALNRVRIFRRVKQKLNERIAIIANLACPVLFRKGSDKSSYPVLDSGRKEPGSGRKEMKLYRNDSG